MRKIVIPVDFSENALNAIKYAVELFKYEQCEIFLLHTYAEEIYKLEEEKQSDDLENLKKETHSTAVDKLEDLEEKIKEFSPNPKHRVKSIASYGLLIDEVNDLVNQENADLVVMGTRGRSNDRSLTFGSNTLQVVKYIQCPVLSIPENFKFNGLLNLLFPTDFMIPYKRRELKLVAETAKSYCASVHMLYISKFPLESMRQRDNQSFFKEQLRDAQTLYHRVEEEDRITAILKEIDALKIDMLVMVNSRYTYLESILYESTINKISLNPRIPFLVLQNYHRESY
ncbi:universal stress protein [Antarcticibacterium flavum]|uniref:Universal stress protein n=1 Tax=Antarcticibacterium flavum TaxID=2058175 RepID=A0A5B7WZZ9_9FLAO|nr:MULTISPECIES: universal stress protein [Antarcticibacterium]MCM4158707.1 universal stress protein [Antarcticibacterium sp. W02-3]QCY68560.1 universal stress protein [Antarcticibacterium flavum]